MRACVNWSLGGECLPLREIGEAEIFEYCVPGLGPELELFFFLFFLGGLWKSRGHGHGHGHGREPILAILKLFLLKSMFFSMNFNRNLSPSKIEKKSFLFVVFVIFAFGSRFWPF
jgi:hypothetical protein